MIPELENIKNYILNPAIDFLFLLAMLYFLYGIVNFLLHFNANDARENGKKHLLWGTIGLAVMVSVYGLINLLGSTIQGLE